MARGTTLANLLTMVKAELGYSLTSGVALAEDTRLKLLLAHNQNWLAAEYDWPFLKRSGDVLLAAGDRTGTIPTTIDTQRPMQVNALDQGDLWVPLTYGISAQDMVTYNSDDDEDLSDPILKWQYATDTTFEVWPRPATATSVRFTGMKKMSTLTSDSDTADLDDLLIVLFTAASEAASQSKPSAPALLARAQKRLTSLQASYPKPFQGFVLGGGCRSETEKDFMGGTITGGTLANTAGGTQPIPNGASSGSVSYGFGGLVPLSVILTVQAPAGGLVIAASLDGPATANGFNYNLTGATDSADYSLHWEATLQ